jgi:hypothetical protein
VQGEIGVTQRHLCGFAVALGVLLFDAGCSSTSKTTDTSSSPTTATGDSGRGPDGLPPANPAQPKPIGTPCTPVQESDPLYAGAAYQEVGVVPGAASCNGGVCVTDHFQGRTTCPYGEEADGGPVPGTCAMARWFGPSCDGQCRTIHGTSASASRDTAKTRPWRRDQATASGARGGWVTLSARPSCSAWTMWEEALGMRAARA